MRRMIARCSQGQGSWIVQYIKQWLGIRIDAEKKLLTVCPMGLLDGFSWEKAYLGGYVFDISYQESESCSGIQVVNYNKEAFEVVFGCRTYGTGAQGKITEIAGKAMPGEKLELQLQPKAGAVEGCYCVEDIELEKLADDDGILLKHFGFLQPCPEGNEHRNVFLARLVLGNRNASRLENVKVIFEVPSCMKIEEKTVRIWKMSKSFLRDRCVICREEVRSGERIVIPVWIELDDEYNASNVWFDHHPALPGKKGQKGKLWIASETKMLETEIGVTLQYTMDGTDYEKKISLPTGSMTQRELEIYARTFLGALNTD